VDAAGAAMGAVDAAVDADAAVEDAAVEDAAVEDADGGAVEVDAGAVRAEFTDSGTADGWAEGGAGGSDDGTAGTGDDEAATAEAGDTGAAVAEVDDACTALGAGR
jgi:hypothetical protein